MPRRTAREEAEAVRIGERRFTVMVVPEGGQGEVRQLTVSLGTVRRWAVGALVVTLLAVLGVVSMVGSFVRQRDERALGERDLALEGRLQEIEQTLDDAERDLRRMRLYTTLLENLPSDGLPGAGPLDPADARLLDSPWIMGSNAIVGDVAPGRSGSAANDGTGDGAVWDEGAIDIAWPAFHNPAADPLRRAESLRDRAAWLARRLRKLEPVAGRIAESVEDWRALLADLPRHWPVRGSLTSRFGYRRSPFTRQWKFHSGLDIAVPSGTLVTAPGPGTIVTAGTESGYGKLIEIDHGHGVVSRLAHNSRLLVRVGDTVQTGEPVATVGRTGRSTGPHVHWEVRIDGQPVDPLALVE